MSDIKLIVGLGNPGAKYDHTRHNMGYDLLEKLCQRYKTSLSLNSKFFGLFGQCNINNQNVKLLFPTTYMNESGRAVGAVCSFYKINPEQILVLHDELDLIPGQIKLKLSGSLAGHNGLKSISAYLKGAQNYYRLRIGIGKPANKDIISFVLNKPFGDEKIAIEAALDAACTGIDKLFYEDEQKAIAFVNGFKLN